MKSKCAKKKIKYYTRFGMNLKDNNLDHIAIIMDGNGRWAEKKGLERTAGHAAGEESLSKSIHWALSNNLKWLTVYAFSTENWMRSSDEVEFLMFFNRDLLKRRREEMTSSNTKLNLVFAFNYGSYNEIHNGITNFINENKQNVDIDYVNKQFRDYLYIPQMPDPDLLIRTAGEQRLSNFLLYQLSYTELMFFETLWPEFSEKDLNKAVEEFSKRKRTYGKA